MTSVRLKKIFPSSVSALWQQGKVSVNHFKERLTQQKSLGMGDVVKGFGTNCTFMSTSPAPGIRHTNPELQRRVDEAKKVMGHAVPGAPGQQSRLLDDKVSTAAAWLASSSKKALGGTPCQVLAACRATSSFEALLLERWGGSDALTQRLLSLPDDPELPSERVHQHRLSLSSALQNVCSTPEQAADVLAALRSGRPSNSPRVDVMAETLRRELAATPGGMAALIHIEGKQDWSTDQKIAYRHSLEITDWLSKQAGGLPDQSARGTGPMSGSLIDFQAHALRSLQASGRQNASIGTEQDMPLQLAHQALLYAQDKMAAQLPADAPHPGLGAYVAWRNGYTHSTPGSPFRAAVHGLGRMRKYVQRATGHGDRTAKNLVKDVGRLVLKMITGKGKDPLLGAVSNGTATAARQRNKEEVAKFQATLGESIDTLKAPLEQDIDALRRKVRTVAETVQLQEKVALWAVLDLWQAQGTKGHTAEVSDVLARAKAAYAEVMLPRDMVRSQLNAAGTGKMRLKKLEAWAFQIFSPPKNLRHASKTQMSERLNALNERGDARSPEENRERRYLQTLLSVSRARELADGDALASKDARNLFQFRDIWRVATGRTPRQGVDLDWLRQVLDQDMQGDEMIQSASDGKSYGVHPDFLLNTSLRAGAIPFGALLRAAYGDEAVVVMGDGAHGSEMSVTKLSRKQVVAGARVGYSATLLKILKLACGGSTAYRHERTQNKDKHGGVVVLIPQDRNTDDATNKQLATRLLNYVFDFSSAATPLTPAELWAGYVAITGDSDRMSLGLREQSSLSHAVQTNAGLSAGVKINDAGLNLGPTAGHEWVSGSDYRKDTAGLFRVQRMTEQQESYFSAGLSLTTPGQKYVGIDGSPLNTAAVPLLGGGIKVPLKSVGTTIRLLEEHGEVNPLESYRDAIFATPEDLARHLRECQTDWARRARYEGHDGRIHDGEEAVAQFVAEAKALAPGRSSVFTTRLMLDPAVAQQLSLLKQQETTLQRSQMGPWRRERELAQVREQIKNLIHDERSWIPKWLAVAEVVGGSTTVSGGLGVISCKATHSHSTKPKSLRLFFSMDVRRSLIEDRRHARAAEPAVAFAPADDAPLPQGEGTVENLAPLAAGAPHLRHRRFDGAAGMRLVPASGRTP